MVNKNFKPSVAELAKKSKSAVIMGVGGGGDVIQAIAVANYLSILGVEKITLGNVSCQWWTEEGSPISDDDDWGRYILGPTIFDVNKLSDAEPWAPQIVGVSSSSNIDGSYPCTAAIRDLLPYDTFVAGLQDGVVGLRDSLKKMIDERDVDLFVGVDIGSDTFHDGKEVSPAASTLVDFMSVSAMLQLEIPTVYGVSGYGCDGELELDELDVRVGRVMEAGGFLGAYGLSQKDVADMLKACELFPDPIEPFAPLAARGDFGLKHVKVVNMYGRRVRVTPLAAIMLFFDPQILADVNSTGIKALSDTESLSEAEKIFKDELGQFPETQLKYVVDYIRGE